MNNRGIMSVLDESMGILPTAEEIMDALPPTANGVDPLELLANEIDASTSAVSSVKVVVQPVFKHLGHIPLRDHIPPMKIVMPDSIATVQPVDPYAGGFHEPNPHMGPIDHVVSQYDLSSLNIRRPCKRGDVIRYMDVKAGLQEVEGVAIAVQMLPVPTEYQLVLVRGKNRFDVVVHKADWLNMADNIRNVENEALSTVESFMEKKTVNFLTVAGGTFGGKTGFSPDFVANRLWKPICGKKLKPIDLMV